MLSGELKKLKSQSKALKPFTIIGKSGISENNIENISKNLKANKLTKIKLLKDYVNSVEASKQDLAKDIAEKTGSELVDQIGQMIVLYKR